MKYKNKNFRDCNSYIMHKMYKRRKGFLLLQKVNLHRKILYGYKIFIFNENETKKYK